VKTGQKVPHRTRGRFALNVTTAYAPDASVPPGPIPNRLLFHNEADFARRRDGGLPLLSNYRSLRSAAVGPGYVPAATQARP